MNTGAKIVSYLFHPLLMATYLFGLLSLFFPSALFPIKAESQLIFILFIFFLTFVLPVLNLLFFRQFGVIGSLTMEERSERIKPFFVISLLYLLSTYLFYYKTRIGFNDSVFKLLLLIDTLVLVSFLITTFFKASIHSLGICGILGVLLPMNKVVEDGSLFVPLLVTICVAGMIMTSRLQLNAHTPRQVLVGAVAGFLTGFLGMIVLF